MPRCAICYENVDKVYICKVCGAQFCAECGDPKRGVCELCITEVDKELDEEEEIEELEDKEEEEEEEEDEEFEEEDEFDEEEEEDEDKADRRRRTPKTRYQVR
jgi:hypothetical protein